MIGSKMIAQSESRILRPSGKTSAILVGACLAFLLVSAWRLHAGHSKALAGVFVLLGLINGAGALHHLLSKIVLFPDRIEFRDLFGNRSLRKETIESVTWA